MYAVEATWPSKSVTKELDNLITLAVKKIFKLKEYDLIPYIRQQIGLHHITDMCNVQKLKFINRFSADVKLQTTTVVDVCNGNDISQLFDMFGLKVGCSNGSIHRAVYV